ncbi:MAG: SocA family protein [Prevotellaceae bacterium]|jgi:uncharacterized phage-associated protein|nr:SocA family protein [Prevotellaceae bacterium]
MKTVGEITKIKTVILFILKECGGKQDFISLVKKMYFSQQQYLVEYGRPIYQDTFRAKRFGPVPVFTYKALGSVGDSSIKDIDDFRKSFGVTIENGVRYISANEDPDMDMLANAEVATIKDVIIQTSGKSARSLSEKSHDEAWVLASERAKDDPTDDYMSLVSIARAGGAKKSMINYIRQVQTFSSFCKS